MVAKKPARASFEEAASIPLAGLTALQALREAAGLRPGQRVLVHAGAGGVGSLAIQIAKILGLHVAATTGGKNADFVRSLGADEVVDYTKEDVAARVRDLDAVFDTLGDASEIRSMTLVKPGGVVVGVSGLPDPGFAMLPWFARPIVWMRTRARRAAIARTGARFVYLFDAPRRRPARRARRLDRRGPPAPVVHARTRSPKRAKRSPSSSAATRAARSWWCPTKPLSGDRRRMARGCLEQPGGFHGQESGSCRVPALVGAAGSPR